MNAGIQDNDVVSLKYTLYVEDEVMERTEENKPIEFIQGLGQVIPGLEEGIYGLSVGDQKTIAIEAKDAYGEFDPESRQKIKQEEFSEEIPLDVGTFLDFRDDDGDVLSAQIIERDEDTVTVDFNHPLAGKDLVFEVEIVGLRPATQEELAHGHVHH